MTPYIQEWLNLAARWVHVIAGIMWVGNSMLFNWLDRNLAKAKDRDPDELGVIWLLHSGGFYRIKKLLLSPGRMPDTLHWFKWQSYITWISGFILLIVVYYADGGTYLIDPGISHISGKMAVAIGPCLLLGGWITYDLLWRSPLGKAYWPAMIISLLLVIGTTFGLCHLFSGRAAFLHIGAMLGTIMAGNVFFHIIPSQKHLVAATEAGRMPDQRFADNAKKRSIHNNYITFPVIFLMISNHFGGLYGNHLNWLILLIIGAAGAGVRFFMNIRYTFVAWIPATVTTVAAAFAALFFIVAPTAAPPPAKTVATQGVPFTVAHAIIQARCLACHSITPTQPAFAAATGGVHYDTPEEIKARAVRIKFRVVTVKTMPLGNFTGITEEERILLGKWVDEGAHIE